MTRSTEKGYDTTRRALKEFREKIRIKDIDAKFINDFERLLVSGVVNTALEMFGNESEPVEARPDDCS